VDRLRALPSTRTVGIGPAPLVGGRGEGLREGFDAIFTFVDTVTRRPPGQTVWLKWVDPGYFATYGVRIRAGRLLTANDDPSNERVVVISKRASKLFFGDRNPLGQTLPHQIPIDSLKVARVVGVIDDELQRDLSIDAAPEILAPIAQARRPSPNPTIAVRSTDAPSKVVADLRAALRATDPQVAAARLEPMTAIINRSLATHRLLVGMLASFGVLAVLIAVVGVYGLVAYFVAQREHEMGVRLALGAQRANVLAMMLAEGGRIVLLGVAVGWALAIGAGRLIASVAFDVHPANITTFVCAGGVLAIVAMAAVFVPSRRAATLDPAMTLRAE
jgi:putative ABC transport system permease protein